MKVKTKLYQTAIGLFSISIMGVSLLLLKSPNKELESIAMLGTLVGFVSLMTSLCMSAMWRMEVDKALNSKSKLSIGILLEFLLFCYGSSKQERKPVYISGVEDSTDALLQLLPQLRQEDMTSMTHSQYAILFTLLQLNDGLLVLATLEALTHIGDRRALPSVRKLAEGNGKARESEAVRDAAQTCLAAIEARLQQQTTSDTLLRPTQAPLPASDTLLRPVAAQKEDSAADAHQLLRPGSGNDTE